MPVHKTNKIKILHLLENFQVGGAEKTTLDICRSLPSDLYHSYVIGFNDGELQSAFKEIGIEAKVEGKRSGIDVNFLSRLRSLMMEKDIDLVHCINGPTVVNYGVMAAKLAKIPSVVAIHGLSHFSEKGIGPLVWRKMLTLATHRIAVSQDICNRAKALLRHGQQMELIYNGIDVDEGQLSADEKASLAAQLGIPADANIVIGCVANFRPVKGHYYLLGAMKLLLSEIPAAHLLLIGSGPLENELRAQVDMLGISANVHFSGKREDVTDCLRLIDIFVLSSLSEGLPISILEAMRANLPVIATDVGGVPEVVLNNLTGVLVKSKNEKELFDALLLVSSDGALRRKLGAAGRDKFENEFNHTIFIEKYTASFKKVSGR